VRDSGESLEVVKGAPGPVSPCNIRVGNSPSCVGRTSAPHWRQNLCSSPTSAPQLWQYAIIAYAHSIAFTEKDVPFSGFFIMRGSLSVKCFRARPELAAHFAGSL
jgi:hypothetical protein